jgi:hypothetical protein
MSNQTAAAIATMTNAVNWERKGLDLQAIIDAGNQGLLGKPLTDWLVAKSWVVSQPTEPTVSAPVLESEIVIDSIIHVDRSIRPSYPDWMKEVMHPDLEAVGPTEYDISTVEQWLHDGQKGGRYVKGDVLYAHLKETNTLKSCLGLRDLEEIQKKGIAFFRKHFKGKAVFGWRSVVQHQSGSLNVPYLCEGGVEVVLIWRWLGSAWFDVDPALRLASSAQA